MTPPSSPSSPLLALFDIRMDPACIFGTLDCCFLCIKEKWLKKMSLKNNCYLSVYGVFRSEFNIASLTSLLTAETVPVLCVSVVECCNGVTLRKTAVTLYSFTFARQVNTYVFLNIYVLNTKRSPHVLSSVNCSRIKDFEPCKTCMQT